MSAMRRFLNASPLAQALVIAAISLGGATALTSGPTNGATPSAATAATDALVTADTEARKLESVVAMLKASTRRCLADQDRMLSADAVGSGVAATAETALRKRIEALQGDRAGDTAPPAVRGILANADLPKEQRLQVMHHVDLRASCLTWAERSIRIVQEHLDRPFADLTELKGMAKRDKGFVRHLANREDAHMGTLEIQAMETFGPRP